MRTQILIVATLAGVAGSAAAQTIDLAGVADGDSRISEFQATASYAQINLGSGAPGDADGLYSTVDDAPFGVVDVFPNETAFGIGDLTYDVGAVTGSGVETVAVTAIDLSDLWSAGSSTTDISGAAFGLWFGGFPTDFVFGAVDGSDTVTFTDGVLTSIDLEIDASFQLDTTGVGGPVATWDGTFSISGADFALAIDDIFFGLPTFTGPVDSQFVADITGTINAVPAPSGALGVLGLALVGTARRRR